MSSTRFLNFGRVLLLSFVLCDGSRCLRCSAGETVWGEGFILSQSELWYGTASITPYEQSLYFFRPVALLALVADPVSNCLALRRILFNQLRLKQLPKNLRSDLAPHPWPRPRFETK